jgi:uncharacterized membrane protein
MSGAGSLVRPGERGAVALITAVLLTAVFGVAAVAVDLGALYAARRDLQAATDSAALAATFGLASAPLATTTAYATNYLTYNGFPASRLSSTPLVTTGRYCPTAATSPPTPSSRFTPGTSSSSVCPGDPSGTSFGSGPNAVQVTASIQSPVFFGRAVSPGLTGEPINATATATQINEAGFMAGTGIANISMGVVNGVLSSLLGGSVSLSALQYNGLVGTNVTALDFLHALAARAGVSAGSYSALLQSTVSVSTVLAAAADALTVEGVVGSASVSALAGLQLLQASASGSASIQVSQLLNLGVLQNQGISSANTATALSAGLNLYDLATLTAEVANGQNAIAVPSTSLGIPGVATVTSSSTVIEPPQSPPFVFGPVGVTVHTSQVRLQLTFTLLGALSVLGGTAPLTLPVYVEAGSGNATLTKISCGLSPATDATVTIAAQSGIGYAYIGKVSASTPLTNFSQPVTVTSAVLSNIAVTIIVSLVQVQISGFAQASLGSPAATALTFNQTQIAAKTAQTVTSTGMVSNLLQTLVTGLQPTFSATLLGLSFTLPSSATTALTSAVAALLSPLAAALDPLVDGLLEALGVKLGYMDVTATGVRCGVPALVL